MSLTLIKNCSYYADDQTIKYGDILLDEESILTIEPEITPEPGYTLVEAQGNLVTPGFIDLQVNGGGDVFFNSNLQVGALGKILKAHERYGTRYMLPTLITCELDRVMEAIEVVKAAMAKYSGILGLHLEGPFLNVNKPGAHNKSLIQKPTEEAIDKILSAGDGVIKMITIAPENFTDAQLKKLAGSNIVISAGHSNATYEQAMHFFGRGVRCVTHLYNAMSPFQGKAPGLVGAALTSGVFAGIIVDGLHAHFNAVEIAYRLKREQLFLVSDASFTHLPDTEKTSLAGIEVSIKDGRIYTTAGKLAGASITLSDALKNCVGGVKIPKAEAIRMATATPAKLLGLENKIGRIRAGHSSRLNLLGQDLNLLKLL